MFAGIRKGLQLTGRLADAARMAESRSMEEELKRINELQLWDFEVAERNGDRLLILGSNDFVYYHYLEAEFLGVSFTDLPARFSHAQFRLGKDSTVWITAESDAVATEFEIQATG